MTHYDVIGKATMSNMANAVPRVMALNTVSREKRL